MAADIPQRLVSVEVAVAAGAGGIGVRNGWVVHLDSRRVKRPVIFEDP
jgi:hypothetical protein